MGCAPQDKQGAQWGEGGEQKLSKGKDKTKAESPTGTEEMNLTECPGFVTSRVGTAAPGCVPAIPGVLSCIPWALPAAGMERLQHCGEQGGTGTIPGGNETAQLGKLDLVMARLFHGIPEWFLGWKRL